MAQSGCEICPFRRDIFFSFKIQRIHPLHLSLDLFISGRICSFFSPFLSLSFPHWWMFTHERGRVSLLILEERGRKNEQSHTLGGRFLPGPSGLQKFLLPPKKELWKSAMQLLLRQARTHHTLWKIPKIPDNTTRTDMLRSAVCQSHILPNMTFHVRLKWGTFLRTGWKWCKHEVILVAYLTAFNTCREQRMK